MLYGLDTDYPFMACGLAFEVGSAMWDFVVDEVALGQVFSEYFGFPCQFSFHQLLQKSSSSIIGVCTIGQSCRSSRD
jgi:hypothetical protein